MDNNNRNKPSVWDAISGAVACLALIVSGLTFLLDFHNSIAEYQGILIVNQSVTVRKQAKADCDVIRDVKCLFSILLNNGKDNFDNTIELFFRLK